ncbi:Phenylalanyl-tRNA synthetase, beta subunit, cytoplasmic [Massospora cicadina]|nr:Phenylalanyl-tRNA synthetase, beta subunit, cytoplasmic [Massospora cicadina]
METLQSLILNRLDKENPFSTKGFTNEEGVELDQQVILGVLNSLLSREMVNYEGSHEAKVFYAVPPTEAGLPISELPKLLGMLLKWAKGRHFKNKWIKKVGTNLVRQVDSIVDQTQEAIKQIRDTLRHSDPEVTKELKRRKLCDNRKVVSYLVSKGSQFALTVTKQATDLTVDMLQNELWKSLSFKQYNFEATGIPPAGGHFHPLLKVREEFRQIFFEMGFQEMPTNKFVESSFWNFDALFQPQQHPARDMHDTFFLKEPATSSRLPQDYVERVKKVHSEGGYGSIGYGYNWKISEAEKLLLRTHTTAVSSHMLYQLAQQPVFKPTKLFSIDRVFRNETVDATHLAEFHQVEGVIADKNLTLGDLIGFMNEFFGKMGVRNLRFKPAYNPYTEPSMEIFSYHEGLGKWVEIGNSGMFRPEMLLPMDLDPEIRVIAWGLSLERPTMIKYGIDNIRSLVGHKVDLGMIQNNPICRLDQDAHPVEA